MVHAPATRRTPRVVLITQARMESTRLPGKVLLDLAGEPLLRRVWERLIRAERVDEVVVAMPDTAANDELESACTAWGAQTYRGALDDVLSRYLGAAHAFCADVVVRVTSDCPFCDPAVIDAVVGLLLSDDSLDYASNNLLRTWPLGLDVEAFRIRALERAGVEATEPFEREHVTPFLYQHPEAFRLANLEAPCAVARPYRLTVDEPSDLELARTVFVAIDPIASTIEDVIVFLDARPDVAAINSEVANKNVKRPASW